MKMKIMSRARSLVATGLKAAGTFATRSAGAPIAVACASATVISLGAPIDALAQSAVQNGHVFVVVNGHARQRSVTTGGSSAKGVLVENGLIGGEDLIVNPPADLKDGQRVEVKS